MKTLPESLARRIEPTDDGCWLWTGLLNRGGYGSVRYRYKLWLAHRLVWHLLRGDVPPVLHHHCRVRSCVNPDHMEEYASTSEHMNDHHADRISECRYGHSMADAYETTRRSGSKAGQTERACRTCKLGARQ